MKHLLIIMLVGVLGCADDGSDAKNECKPLDMRCEGKTVFRCAPDTDLSRHGKYVYVWNETLVCEDDEVFGKATCVESMLPTGRVDAECEYASEED